jgi:hypothetical protein
LKWTRRFSLLLAVACAAIAISNIANAQQIDIGAGMSSILAPAASQATGTHQQQSVDGAPYLSVSGDVLFHHRTGVEGEFSWRENQGVYLPSELNLNYRPIFWSVNGIWVPKVTKRISIEVLSGLGQAQTRFYNSSPYSSNNHLMFDFGGGIKAYWHHFFLRPEARIYLVNNYQEFSSSHALRYGATIGYTFKPRK